MKITLEKFCDDWKKVSISLFEMDIFNFTTKAGDYSKQKFQSSFVSKSFIGLGALWKSRQSKWGKRHKHDLMHDSGTLSSTTDVIGIIGKAVEMSKTFVYQAPSPGQRKINHQYARYYIRTYAKSTTGKRYGDNYAKRGTNPKSDNSYAAVHNTDPKLGLYKVNQRPGAGAPEQRQFIGFHPSIDEYIAGLIPEIFSQFPFPQK